MEDLEGAVCLDRVFNHKKRTREFESLNSFQNEAVLPISNAVAMPHPHYSFLLVPLNQTDIRVSSIGLPRWQFLLTARANRYIHTVLTSLSASLTSLLVAYCGRSFGYEITLY